jgi:hypothetical protein
MMSSAPTSTVFSWWIRTAQIGGTAIPVARLRSPLFFRTLQAGITPAFQWCWLDTAAPLSVVPFRVYHQKLAWQPIPGVQMTWAGQPCALGRADIWVPTKDGSGLRGPFPLLAKFPLSDPPGSPTPILLGLEFLLASRASFMLWPPPQQGILEIP